MYRFALSPKWILSHVLVLIVVITMINFGFWQLRRHDQRAARNDLIEQRAELPPVALGQALAETDDPADLDFVVVETVGEYRDDDAVLVANRHIEGAPGFWVMAPLDTDDGLTIWVSRGFINRATASEDGPAAGSQTTGPIVVTGFLKPSVGGGSFAASDSGPPVVNRPDTALLSNAEWGDFDDLGVFIQADNDPGPALVAVPLPTLDGGPHLSYAVQWFVFATIAAVGYPLILRKVARDRARPRVDTDTLGDDDRIRS